MSQKNTRISKEKETRKKKIVGKTAKKVTKKKIISAGKFSKKTLKKGADAMAEKSQKKEEKFKVGEHLVYPMHGVGQITSVSRQSILGKKKNCYILEIASSKMKVMVPVEKASEIGVRSIITKREVRKVINLLKKEEMDTEEDWKLRYQNNMNKIKSGNIYSVAEVCRNLYKRACNRELSLMERRLYESAYRLISSEIALTKNVSVEEAGNIISEVLA